MEPQLKQSWDIDIPLVNAPRRLRLVVARHGQSVWNDERRVQGQQGPGLTKQGHQQAEALADHLVATVPDVHRVYSSDLPRATQTAAPYIAATGHTLVTDERLREIDSGEWSGRMIDDVAVAERDYVHRIRTGEDLPRGRTGETWADVHARVGAFLDELCVDAVVELGVDEEATVVVFSHGGAIRALCAEVLGLGVGGHTRVAAPTNCSITELDLRVDGTGRGCVGAVSMSRPSSVLAARPDASLTESVT